METQISDNYEDDAHLQQIKLHQQIELLVDLGVLEQIKLHQWCGLYGLTLYTFNFIFSKPNLVFLVMLLRIVFINLVENLNLLNLAHFIDYVSELGTNVRFKSSLEKGFGVFTF